MTNKIWCLFSIENNYDQPENNLVTWWSEKPTIERLAKYMCHPLDKSSDEDLMVTVAIWRGQGSQYHLGDTHYRLEEVEECKA